VRAGSAERRWEWGESGEFCFASMLRQRVRVMQVGRDWGLDSSGVAAPCRSGMVRTRGLARVVDIVLGKYFASGPVKFDVGPYCLNGPAQIDCSNEFPITKLI
jgi:hypothetical protein